MSCAPVFVPTRACFVFFNEFLQSVSNVNPGKSICKRNVEINSLGKKKRKYETRNRTVPLEHEGEMVEIYLQYYQYVGGIISCTQYPSLM